MDLLQYTASLPGGSGQWTSCNTLPTAWGQWAVDLLQYAAPLPGGSGQWTSCNTLPHCLGAVGSGPPSMHCHTAWGQWAVDPPQCTACCVVWCGVVWSGVVWCGVVWCAEGAVTKRQKARMSTHG